MKYLFNKLGALALLSGSLLLAGCDPEIDANPTSAGELNLTKYIAVGNSLTAGFMDGGLYREGQLSSYPNILAQQFSQVGGGGFVQPLFSEEQANGSGYLRLSGFSSAGSPMLTPVTTNLAVRLEQPLPGGPKLTKFTDATIQNLGVPGMSVLSAAVPQYGAINPYYERLLQPAEVGARPYLQFIGGRNHTFFTCWLGNNDVLTYATNGGVQDPNNPFSGITDPSSFAAIYTQIINVLTANNAKGLVATIPDVTGIPYFTTVGPQVKALLRAASVPGVVALTKNTNTRLLIATTAIKDATGGTILFTLPSSSYSALVGRPTGKYWRDLARTANPANPQAQLQNYISTYALDTTQAFGFSVGNPLPSAFILDDTEQTEIRNATTTFNSVIKAVGQTKNLAVFDVFEFFDKEVQPAIVNGQAVPKLNLNGVAYSPAFITGNLFSLDGVHLTPRGYAILANEMIKAINTKYNSSIPTTDVTQYRTVVLP